MAIVSYDPFRNVRTLQNEINRLFDTDRDYAEGSMAAWALRVDIKEDQERIVLKADIPGMEQKDISVNVENNTLTLSGERTFAEDEKRDDYHRVERAYGRFSRSFQLPNTTDTTHIQAEYKNGVLEVTLPKLPEAKPRAIEVQVH